MKKLRTYPHRFPVLFSLMVTLAILGISEIIGRLYLMTPDILVFDLLYELVSLLWPVGLALLFGFGFALKEKGFGKTLKAGLGFFLFYCFGVVVMFLNYAMTPDCQWKALPEILLGILMLVGIGVREEVLFRGIVGNTLALKFARDGKGIWKTLLISGLLFGGIHMFNVLAGVDFMGALAQSCGAVSVGILFMAIYLRGGSLWFMMLLHALVDAAALFESSFVEGTVTDIEQLSNTSFLGVLVMAPVYLLAAAFLLRKSKRPQILERLQSQRQTLGLE